MVIVIPQTTPMTDDEITSLHLLAVNDPYIRLNDFIMMPPTYYFEWTAEKVNTIGAENGCAFQVESWTQTYKITLDGAGCLESAQELRDIIWSALGNRPGQFERHLQACAQFEQFTYRSGVLQNDDLLEQIRCSGRIVLVLTLTIALPTTPPDVVEP